MAYNSVYTILFSMLFSFKFQKINCFQYYFYLYISSNSIDNIPSKIYSYIELDKCVYLEYL